MNKRNTNRTADGSMVNMQEFLHALRGGTYRIEGYIRVHSDGTLEFNHCVFTPVEQLPLSSSASEHVH